MTRLIVPLALIFAAVPISSHAAINSINTLTGAAQVLSTTTGTTTMHMNIVNSGTTTHIFQWDLTPWRVDQGGTGTTSFSNGSVLFYSNGFTQNNANFFWDTIHNALNVGTSSNSLLSRFAVQGTSGLALFNALSTSGSSKFYVSETGNVGIGTTNPLSALDIIGSLYTRLVTPSDASSLTLDWNQSNVQKIILNTNVTTLAFNNGQAGGEYKLVVKQDATGGRSIVWPSSVLWPGGTAPTLTGSANAEDLISFVKDNSNYLGSYNLNYSASSGSTTVAVDNTASSTTGSLTYTANNSNVTLMLEVQTSQADGSTPSCTDNGSSMSVGGPTLHTGPGVSYITVLYETGVASGSRSISCTGPSFEGLAAVGYSGAGSPSFGSAYTVTSTSTLTDSLTTTNNNSWVGGAFIADFGHPVSTNSTFVDRVNNLQNSSIMDTNTGGPTGTYTVNANSSSGGTRNFAGYMYEIPPAP